MDSWGVPLENETRIYEAQWISKGYPLQDRHKSNTSPMNS